MDSSQQIKNGSIPISPLDHKRRRILLSIILVVAAVSLIWTMYKKNNQALTQQQKDALILQSIVGGAPANQISASENEAILKSIQGGNISTTKTTKTKTPVVSNTYSQAILNSITAH